MNWKKNLRYDPIPVLVASKNEALRYYANHDLLEIDSGPVDQLWRLPKVHRLVEAQEANGAWRYHGGKPQIRSSDNYDQIETYRILRELVEKYGLNRSCASIRIAADFLFRHQTVEGDFRGICGTQYVPYYSAAFMELLIKSGYAEDSRIEKGLKWLLSIRQEDGGWAFPLRTVGRLLDAETFASQLIQPDRSRPFSHLVTGVVLRAFAAHPRYRRSGEAMRAGELLASRFFKPDVYPDRRGSSFWTSFSYPFWFTDLLSSLDSLSLMGFSEKDPGIAEGLEWFASRQGKTGLWKLRLRLMATETDPDSWITLAICRVLKRVFG